MRRIWIILSGSADLSFERRQTTLVTTVGAILCLLAAVINAMTGQALAMTIFSAASAVILIVLRLLIRQLPNLNVITAGLAVLGIMLGIMGWVTSSGVFGSAPYVFFLVLTWLLAIRNHRAHFVLIATILLLMATLILLQVYFPHLIIPYPDQNAQFADLITGSLLTLLFQAFFISSLRFQFEEEQGALREKNQELAGITGRLSHAKEQADAALAVRSNFIAAMSHELRTPLTSVIAGTRLLRKSENAAEHEEIKDFIERSAESLLRVIDDILVLRSEEAGEISIVSAEFGTQDMINDLLRMYSPLAEEKGLKINLHLGDSVPDKIYSDAARVSQIISNLLSNAIKYTKKGEIQLTLQLLPTENGHDTLRISVADSGPGIPADEQPNLFKPFMRSADARRHVRGTGLGLSICAMLALRLGGTIQLTNSGPTGSLFTVDLPIAIPKVRKTKSEVSADLLILAGKKILIAEDDEINALLLRRILEHHHVDCTVVKNGQELIELALSNKWDLIITDIQMPEVDGFQAARRIIETLGQEKSPSILAMSASSFAEEEENISRSGIAAWISKPYDEIGLLNCVMLHIA